MRLETDAEDPIGETERKLETREYREAKGHKETEAERLKGAE